MDGDAELFDTKVSDMQSNVNIAGNSIIGTLKFIEGGIAQSGPLSGDGNFLALQFKDIDPTATSVKVGLDPSQGSGLVEIINDPDKNGVFKITNKATQKFKVVTTDGTHTRTQTFDLSALICEAE